MQSKQGATVGSRTRPEAVSGATPSSKKETPKEKGVRLKAELDAMLDEVDEALEEGGISSTAEAQAMVEGYEQRGGE